MGTKSTRLFQKACLNCCKGDNPTIESQNQFEEGKEQCYQYTYKTIQKQVENVEEFSIQFKQNVFEIKQKSVIKKTSSQTSKKSFTKKEYDKKVKEKAKAKQHLNPSSNQEQKDKSNQIILYQLKANSLSTFYNSNLMSSEFLKKQNSSLKNQLSFVQENIEIEQEEEGKEKKIQ